ncbi:hypothetical protein D3C78_1091130 [compost metagenome]
MAIIRFEKKKKSSCIWFGEKHNQDGYVLNINTWSPLPTSTKNVIHSARYCSTLDESRIENRDRLVTSEHHKLCSTDISELEAEMNDKGLSYKRCRLCMKWVITPVHMSRVINVIFLC